ncbi:MAG: diversity-generating retroelement protein Avd [Accumulibacter sp.]|jgi:four helix bundle protein|uniref:diversity-generating retroelement protein Avd n=1 Tax=Accumulibacter sp. TaxID=2053492 RepID=UPI002FC2D826
MPTTKELVIFTQTYDLLTWLLPHCERFPKTQRFVVTQRLQGAALDFQEAIFEANARHGAQRLQHLQAADAQLNKLRLYLRLARQWDWLSSGQYEHVSRLVAQVGRLLGGWIRQTASGRPARSGREAEDFS